MSSANIECQGRANLQELLSRLNIVDFTTGGPHLSRININYSKTNCHIFWLVRSFWRICCPIFMTLQVWKKGLWRRLFSISAAGPFWSLFADLGFWPIFCCLENTQLMQNRLTFIKWFLHFRLKRPHNCIALLQQPLFRVRVHSMRNRHISKSPFLGKLLLVRLNAHHFLSFHHGHFYYRPWSFRAGCLVFTLLLHVYVVSCLPSS